jgi:hypothetical protein
MGERHKDIISRMKANQDAYDKKEEWLRYNNPFPEEHKKSGLYHDGVGKNRRIIDISGDSESGWFWGYMSDYGNYVSQQMWHRVEYIGPVTIRYADEIIGLMNCDKE